jgi:hypothetical protein
MLCSGKVHVFYGYLVALLICVSGLDCGNFETEAKGISFNVDKFNTEP